MKRGNCTILSAALLAMCVISATSMRLGELLAVHKFCVECEKNANCKCDQERTLCDCIPPDPGVSELVKPVTLPPEALARLDAQDEKRQSAKAAQEEAINKLAMERVFQKEKASLAKARDTVAKLRPDLPVASSNQLEEVLQKLLKVQESAEANVLHAERGEDMDDMLKPDEDNPPDDPVPYFQIPFSGTSPDFTSIPRGMGPILPCDKEIGDMTEDDMMACFGRLPSSDI